MLHKLQKLIDNNEISEMEIVEFLSTIKKLSQNHVIDIQSYKTVLEYFGLKEKNGWVKFGDSSKYKF